MQHLLKVLQEEGAEELLTQVVPQVTRCVLSSVSDPGILTGWDPRIQDYISRTKVNIYFELILESGF